MADDPRLVPYSRADASRSCRGKVRWPSRQAAEVAAARQSDDFDADLEAYGCPHCGGWHTGNVPRWLALDRACGVFAPGSSWPHR